VTTGEYESGDVNTIGDEDEFDETETILRAVLTEATKFLAHQS